MHNFIDNLLKALFLDDALAGLGFVVAYLPTFVISVANSTGIVF